MNIIIINHSILNSALCIFLILNSTKIEESQPMKRVKKGKIVFDLSGPCKMEPVPFTDIIKNSYDGTDLDEILAFSENEEYMRDCKGNIRIHFELEYTVTSDWIYVKLTNITEIVLTLSIQRQGSRQVRTFINIILCSFNF